MTAIEHPLSPDELMEYLDGELTVEQAAAVQAHVATCAGCQRLSVELHGVSRNLAQWQVEDPAGDVHVPEPIAQLEGEFTNARSLVYLQTHELFGRRLRSPSSGIVLVVAIGTNLLSRYSLEPLPPSPAAFGWYRNGVSGQNERAPAGCRGAWRRYDGGSRQTRRDRRAAVSSTN